MLAGEIQRKHAEQDQCGKADERRPVGQVAAQAALIGAGEPAEGALHTLLDNIELIAVIINGIDGLARKGEVIGDTLAEVLAEVRAAGKATGLNLRETSEQLSTLIPTLAEASPAIRRVDPAREARPTIRRGACRRPARRAY